MAESTAAGRLLTGRRALAMIYHLQFAALLPYWRVLLDGLIFTIVLTLVSTFAGVDAWDGGCVRADIRAALGSAACVVAYVELIRNTPFIVQLFFIFFGLPALGLKLSETAAAFIAMTINLGAYSTEIIRAGIEAVPKGHIEAGVSLAMSKWEVLALRRAQAGVPEDLSGAVFADHHRHARIGGGVADLRPGPDLRGQFRAVADLPSLRSLSGGGGHLSLAGDRDACPVARAWPRPVSFGGRRPCCSSASGTFCRTC